VGVGVVCYVFRSHSYRVSPLSASTLVGVHDWRSQGGGAGNEGASPDQSAPGADHSSANNASRGDIFNYFAFGAACAEVELDVLSGLFEVRRVDILMDVGHTLNPAIDIGQVEGAFVQGLGRWTMEEIKFSAAGVMTTTNPHTYFVPTSADVPRDMRITLLGDAPSPTSVHSSKAVGEPPFFLSSCVFFALKEAIHAARAESGLTGFFRVDAPATAHRIRMACGMAACVSAAP
jgi:xanthine dehydrogenase/oxidase